MRNGRGSWLGWIRGKHAQPKPKPKLEPNPNLSAIPLGSRLAFGPAMGLE